jgi:hypothetical protein
MYVKHKGKTFLKMIFIRNANEIIRAGSKQLLPPVGVMFEGPVGLYLVTEHMPQPRYFKATPASRDGTYQGDPITAIVGSIKSIVDLPAECPPPEEWPSYMAPAKKKGGGCATMGDQEPRPDQ